MYDSRWFTALNDALLAGAASFAESDSDIVVKLYKGQATVPSVNRRTAFTLKTLLPLVQTFTTRSTLRALSACSAFQVVSKHKKQVNSKRYLQK